MKLLLNTMYLLILVGALNWGLVGAFNFDLVQFVCGGMNTVTRFIYTLVGVAAVVKIGMMMTGHCCTTCKK